MSAVRIKNMIPGSKAASYRAADSVSRKYGRISVSNTEQP